MEVHLVLKSFCPSSTLLQTEKKKKNSPLQAMQGQMLSN